MANADRMQREGKFMNDPHDNAQTDKEMLERLQHPDDKAFEDWFQREYGFRFIPEYGFQDRRSAWEAGRHYQSQQPVEPSIGFNVRLTYACDLTGPSPLLVINVTLVPGQPIPPIPYHHGYLVLREVKFDPIDPRDDGNDWIFEQDEDAEVSWLLAQPPRGKHEKPE